MAWFILLYVSMGRRLYVMSSKARCVTGHKYNRIKLRHCKATSLLVADFEITWKFSCLPEFAALKRAYTTAAVDAHREVTTVA